MSFGTAGPRPKNFFVAAKKNALASRKSAPKQPSKKMSEAERIMREEMVRKKKAEERGSPVKKIKFGL